MPVLSSSALGGWIIDESLVKKTFPISEYTNLLAIVIGISKSEFNTDLISSSEDPVAFKILFNCLVELPSWANFFNESTLIVLEKILYVEPLRNFLEILQKVPGYSIDIFLKRVPRLINEPYTKEMGIKIAKKVTEKGVVRLVKIAAGANI